jgi:hypothetical protein
VACQVQASRHCADLSGLLLLQNPDAHWVRIASMTTSRAFITYFETQLMLFLKGKSPCKHLHEAILLGGCCVPAASPGDDNCGRK